jgi:hypothetical protein
MNTTDRVREIYERYVQPLTDAERLQLVALVTTGMAETAGEAAEPPKRSLLELRGLGKEIWEGIDPDEYVRSLRHEWDHRP